MKILVTGGAGYVGSIVSEQLVKQGHEVYVLDNLKQGYHAAVPYDAVFMWFDIDEVETLEDLFAHGRIEAVMHSR